MHHWHHQWYRWLLGSMNRWIFLQYFFLASLSMPSDGRRIYRQPNQRKTNRSLKLNVMIWVPRMLYSIHLRFRSLQRSLWRHKARAHNTLQVVEVWSLEERAKLLDNVIVDSVYELAVSAKMKNCNACLLASVISLRVVEKLRGNLPMIKNIQIIQQLLNYGHFRESACANLLLLRSSFPWTTKVVKVVG